MFIYLRCSLTLFNNICSKRNALLGNVFFQTLIWVWKQKSVSVTFIPQTYLNFPRVKVFNKIWPRPAYFIMAFKTSSLQAGVENFTSSLGKFNTTLIHFPYTCGVESKNQTPVWANCNRRSTRFCVSTSLLNYLVGLHGPIWKSCVIIPWTTVRRGSLTGLMVMNTIMWNRLRQ